MYKKYLTFNQTVINNLDTDKEMKLLEILTNSDQPNKTKSTSY